MTLAKVHDKKEKPETAENIFALVIFGIIILIVIGLFTNGFGLLNKGFESGERVNLPLGDNPSKGNYSNPKIVIVIFSDFECPFCKRGEDSMSQVYEKYKDRMVVVFKNYPLTQIHKNAFNAALAAECADEQGKFWEYHDVLFSHNTQLANADLNRYAQDLGLDTAKFSECLDSQKYKYSVEKDMLEGREAGVSGTPTFFINGLPLVGAQPASEFEKIIEAELKK